MIEVDYMRELMVHIGAWPELRIWRQNCGGIVKRDAKGRPIGRFASGVPDGAADISGIAADGSRIEIECKMKEAIKKKKGKLEENQEAWRDMIEKYGGIHIVVVFDPDISLEENMKIAGDLVKSKVQSRISERQVCRQLAKE